MRAIGRVLVALALVIGLALLGLVLGAIPVPAPSSHRDGDADMHAVYVISNGFHSAIAVPSEARIALEAGSDERQSLLERLALGIDDFPVDPDQVRYWQFGWGSKTAYTSLRAVRDLTPAIAARALAFDVSVMHVQPLGELRAGDGVYRLDLTTAQLDALVASIAPYFSDTQPIAGTTQGFGDRFYPGRGRFSPVNSCNSWTGRRLRAAGVGVGAWTPIAATLEFGLGRVQAR